jgi:hypothetical protein
MMACFTLKANGRISARSTLLLENYHSDFKEALNLDGELCY